jgi:hypothetical protein
VDLASALPVIALVAVLLGLWFVYWWVLRRRRQQKLDPTSDTATLTYWGGAADALAQYELDGTNRALLEGLGYRPVGQTYVRGRWSPLAVGLAVLLIFGGGIGLVLLLGRGRPAVR